MEVCQSLTVTRPLRRPICIWGICAQHLLVGFSLGEQKGGGCCALRTSMLPG